MKLLLDEQLSVKLRHTFAKEHLVYSTTFMGWGGKKNGQLLAVMTEAQFDGLITNDKSIPYQQNLSKFPVKILMLNARSNDIKDLIPQAVKLVEILRNQPTEQVIEAPTD